MTVSPALARVYASAPSDDDFIETLELAHPLFSKTHYLTPQPVPFAAKLNNGADVVYLPLPFAVQLPGQTGEGQQDLVLAIDNVDQQLVAELERAAGDPTQLISCVYRVYTEHDPNPAFTLPALTISDVSISESAANATAARTDVLNRPFPSQVYTLAMFPGLDR